jgi:phage-related protein
MEGKRGEATHGATRAIYYRDKHGVEPVNRFLNELPAKRAAKIDAYVEEYLNGRPSSAPPPEHPISSQIEGDLRELRVRFAATRYRILYQRSRNLIVLLHAFEKDTGAVSTADKATAKRRMADFRRRMNARPRVPPRAVGRDAPSGHRRR